MDDKVLCERRLMMGFTGLTILGFLLEIVAISTDWWLSISINVRNHTDNYLQSIHAGLWRFCKIERDVQSGPDVKVESCEYHNFFPSRKEVIYDKTIDIQIIDYMRTGCAFGVITIMLMFLVHLFAVYTIKRPRYIFKRLTALLHIMTAGCIIVMNEVFIRTVEYAEKNLPQRHPIEADPQYGYSFILSWIVFVFYAAAGLAFLFTSRKRKTEMDGMGVRLAEEDEPMEIRRVV